MHKDGILFERVLGNIINSYTNNFEYYISCAKYRKKHGYIAYLGNRKLDEEERHIRCAYEETIISEAVVFAQFELLNYDKEEIDRAYIAARVLNKWYERTHYERIPSRDIISKLERFVCFG